MIGIFFLSQSSPILELFPFDKITLKSYICTVVTVMAKQCWSQTVLESGSWGHSVLQTPTLVTIIKQQMSDIFIFETICMKCQALFSGKISPICHSLNFSRECLNTDWHFIQVAL